MAFEKEVQVLKLPELVVKTKLARSSIYRLMKQGKFPSGFKISDGGRATGWLLSDIDSFLTKRAVCGGKK